MVFVNGSIDLKPTRALSGGLFLLGRVAGLCTPGHPCSFAGVSSGAFAANDPLLQPVQHFGLNPSDAVGPEVDPLGECSGLFQPRDMLGRVQDQLLELAL
jgi:hypothetical protein